MNKIFFYIRIRGTVEKKVVHNRANPLGYVTDVPFSLKSSSLQRSFLIHIKKNGIFKKKIKHRFSFLI